MGIFSSITSKVKDVGNVLAQAFNPFSKVKPTVSVNIPVVTPVLKTLVEHPYASAGVVAGGITAITKPAVVLSAIKTVAAASGTIIKSVLPTSSIGRLSLGAVGLVTAGAIAKEPIATTKAIAKVATGLFNIGGNIGTLAKEPSLGNVKSLISENPVLVTAGVVVGALATGKVISSFLPAIATHKQTEAIQEQTEAIKQSSLFVPATSSLLTVPDKTLVTSSVTPTGQETQVVTSSTPRKRRRTSQNDKKARGNINQRVNVIVSNKSISTGFSRTQKYLNRTPLLN